MNRRREKSKTLTGSRIYVRDNSYKYFAHEPIYNQATGKTTKWVRLCSVAEGELVARQKLAQILKQACVNAPGQGDFPVWFAKWRQTILEKRSKNTPRDPARADIWKKGTRSVMDSLGKVENAFADFDLVQVQPADIALFLDQWEGRRSAQSYKGYLVKFFAWCCRKGVMTNNPAREVTVEKVKTRKVYMTNQQFNQIRDALLVGEDDKPTPSGPMVQVYMDLLYLLYQRGTDIRLLKWNEIQPDGIYFKPTKTEAKSGIDVRIPMTPAIAQVLDRARAIKKMHSLYVIHTQNGQPYTANGIGTAFRRAAKRAKVSGVTLKDIRAKAATDAKKQGFSEEDLKVALAHTDVSTTRDYIKEQDVPVSKVSLNLPKK